MKPATSDAGQYLLLVYLNDGCSFSEYPLNIHVANSLNQIGMAL